MPLSTNIITAKELASAYQPLLLCEFVFADGSTLFLSTHPLNVGEGGATYGGNSYLARVKEQDIEQLAARTESGIVMPPAVTLHLFDADKLLFTSYENATGKGFKGAKLEMRLVFWEAETSNYSTTSQIAFIGRCEQPIPNAEYLVVRAASATNMSRELFPILRVQPRCSWVFPSNKAQRIAAAVNVDSEFYECGYSPDVTNTDVSGGTAAARGNYVTGTTPYTTCDYTFESCIARLGNNHTPPFNSGNLPTIMRDSSNRSTGRFSGVRWVPPTDWRGKDFLNGQKAEGTNAEINSRYSASVPMVYGTAWVNAIPLQSLGDPNSTRGEAIVCLGQVTDILTVLVNDVRVAPSTDITRTYPYVVPDKLLRFDIVNDGRRDGNCNGDAIYDYNGDPYGSQCVIAWVTPKSVVSSGSKPNVRVLVRGPNIRVYSDASTFTDAYTENPVWQLLDILTWSSWNYADLDLQSFVDAAAVCDGSVSFVGASGSTSSHARYSSSFVLNERKSAGRIVDSLLRSFNAALAPDPSTGKLKLLIDGTLATQQPAPVSGSNYNTAVASLNYAGAATNGYVAYAFDEGNILQGSFKGIGVTSPSNRVTVPIIDEQRDRVESTYTRVVSEDVARSGSEQTTSLDVIGLQNFDQAARIVSQFQAKALRGNAFFDTRGTRRYEFQTTFKAVHLRLGHLVRLTWQHEGIVNQLFRIDSIKPTTNWERATLTVSWHDDVWFTDAYGQAPDTRASDPKRNRRLRPPFAWSPNYQAPIASNALYDPTEKSFGLRQIYDTAADGTAIAHLEITGAIPVNQFNSIRPPLVTSQGTTATTGGSLPGSRVYYMAVCARDSSGKLSMPTDPLVVVQVISAGNTNTITMPVALWDSQTTGFALFVGTDPNRLQWQANNDDSSIAESGATPATITFEGPLQVASWGLPDIEAQRLQVAGKLLVHAGIFGGAVSNVSGSVVTLPGLSWGSSPVGYKVSGIADGNTALFVPVADYTITAYSGDTLTLSPNPSGAISVGDVLVVRSKPTVGANYVEDALWVNSGGSGLTADAEIGNYLRIIAGTGRGYSYRITDNTSTRIYVDGPWIVTPDATSVYVIEAADWLFSITSGDLSTSDPAALITLRPDINNYSGQSLLVQVLTVDADGNQSLAFSSPLREIYIFGEAGSVGGGAPAPDVSAYGTVTVTDGADESYYKISGSVTWPALTHTDVDTYEILLEGPKIGGSTWPTPIPFSGRLNKSSGSATVTYTSDGTWKRPPSADGVFRVSVVSYNADGIPTTPAGATAEFTVAHFTESGTTPSAPGQPGSGDWSVAVLAYGTDRNDEQVANIRATVTTVPAAADYVQAWIFKGSSPPADLSLWRDVAAAKKAASGNTLLEFLVDREAVTYQVTITASTSTYTQFPTSGSVIKTVTLSAAALAAAPSAFSVSAIDDGYSDGLRYGHYVFAPTLGSDPLRTEIRVRGRFNVAGFGTPGAWEPFIASLPGDSALPWSQDKRSWPWPSDYEYREFQAGSVNREGSVNWGPIAQITLPPSGGLKLNQVDSTSTGSEFAIVNGKFRSMTEPGGNLIVNGNFDAGLHGWETAGTVTLYTYGGHSTPNQVMLSSLYAGVKQLFGVRGGEHLAISAWWLKNAGANGAGALRLGLFDQSMTFMDYAYWEHSGGVSTAWTEQTVTYHLPVNTRFVEIYFYANFPFSTFPTDNWFLDCIRVTEMVEGGDIAPDALGPGLKTVSNALTIDFGGGLKLNVGSQLEIDVGSRLGIVGNKVIIPDLAIDFNALAAGSVGGNKFKVNAIDSPTYFSAGVISNSAILGTAVIVDGHIQNLNAAKVNFGVLQGISITSVTITGSTLTLNLSAVTTKIANQMSPDGVFIAGVLIHASPGPYPFTAIGTTQIRSRPNSASGGYQLEAGDGTASNGAKLSLYYGAFPSVIIDSTVSGKVYIDGTLRLSSIHPNHGMATSVANAPPFVTDLESLRNKYNELLAALRAGNLMP